MTIKGSLQQLRGSISVGPADNLGSQSLGGFKALNAALRKCRQCMVVKEDMQTQVSTLIWQPAGIRWPLMVLCCIFYSSLQLVSGLEQETHMTNNVSTSLGHLKSTCPPPMALYATLSSTRVATIMQLMGYPLTVCMTS